ncbi:hypothetical protein RRG08_034037 [Elysia crispata]|uniref:Uncharacterized protein n=1 Tax=Elysia crispata TaxID=231223 RepID=A0AAE0YKC8_9GAST|nr:hypothetical protein RRG08_034037 [Elysia crispata]
MPSKRARNVRSRPSHQETRRPPVDLQLLWHLNNRGEGSAQQEGQEHTGSKLLRSKQRVLQGLVWCGKGTSQSQKLARLMRNVQVLHDEVLTGACRELGSTWTAEGRLPVAPRAWSLVTVWRMTGNTLQPAAAWVLTPQSTQTVDTTFIPRPQ